MRRNAVPSRFWLRIVPWPVLVVSLSAVSALLAGRDLSDAAERELDLPRTPFNYSNVELPPHFVEAAKSHDNTPPDNPITDDGATLGRVLFYDERLSVNGTTACASCHRQELAFTDNQPVSTGFDGGRVTRNSMSLINLRYYANGRFFWDERAATLEEQVLLPIENAVEMGHSLNTLVPQLQSDPIYPPLFRNAFGSEQVSADRIAKALAQFLRSIVSYRSKYDRGRAAVQSVYDAFPNFTRQENYGKQLFLEQGRCANCHLADSQRASNTDRQSAFFFLDRAAVNGVDGKIEGSDPGIGGHTGRPGDLGAFKVPSLRNIALTGPYMHDGRFTTIDRVIEHYNWGIRPHPNLDPRLREEGRTIFPERPKVALTAFLVTLTDHALIEDRRFADPFVRRSRRAHLPRATDPGKGPFPDGARRPPGAGQTDGRSIGIPEFRPQSVLIPAIGGQCTTISDIQVLEAS